MGILTAAAAAMTCTVIGAAFSGRLRLRYDQLSMLVSLTDEMAQRIRYGGVRLPELMEQLSEEKLYSGCYFFGVLTDNLKKGVQINEAWQAAAQTAFFLNERDRLVLGDIGARLGGSDTEGQLSMLTLGNTMLSRGLEEARADCEKKAKMIMGVWALCGIGAGIIII